LRVSSSVSNSLVEEVHEVIRGFAPKAASAEIDLLDSGLLDSANLVQVLLALETRFAVSIPLEEVDLESLRTVVLIAELVHERQSATAAAPLAKAAVNGAGESHEPRSVSPVSSQLEPGPDPLLQEIHLLFQNSLSIDVPSPETDLFRAGLLDSMFLVQLIMTIENQYGCVLSIEDLDVASFSTTARIAGLVREVTSRT
jgi:acyl carrier protein